jgi:hypothetical protein
MTITVSPEHFSPARYIIDQWLNTIDRRITGNQKEVARAEGARIGTLQGLADGLASFLTKDRCERLPKWKYVPAVESYQCQRFIQEAVDVHAATFGSLPARKADITAEMKADAENQFSSWFDQNIENLTMPADIALAELQRHQKAVLAKEEPATDDDREWLQREMDAQKAALEELRGLLT